MLSVRAGLAVIVALLVLTACGNGGDDDSGSATTQARADLTVNMSDFRFAPARWSGTAASMVSVDLENSSGQVHDWTILQTPIENEGDFDSSDVLFSIELTPGSQQRAELTLPGPGTYQVICSIPSHFSLGMEGTLRVTG